MMEKSGNTTPKSPLSPINEGNFTPTFSYTWGSTLLQTPSRLSSPKVGRSRQPWRHSVSKHHSDVPSQTVREYKPDRQRRRLFWKTMFHWSITTILCALLAGCLIGFARLPTMSVSRIKLFNALIVLLSLFLGNNLSSTLREFACMFRWRLLASKYRSLEEFDLLMQCDSLRKVLHLIRASRNMGRAWFLINRTQRLCVIWLFINICLQVLVALLGLTYNLNTSRYPGRQFGNVSVANLTDIRDIWSTPEPKFDAELSSANSFGIQGQDYNFVQGPPPGQTGPWLYGTPGTPTVYGNGADWDTYTYAFQDQNIRNNQLTFVSRRTITINGTCTSHTVLAGGNGTAEFVTYLDDQGIRTTLDVPPVGPGAVTYIGVLNSTCGPRCSQVMALQSADGDAIPQPRFFTCTNTLSQVQGYEQYLYPGWTAETFQMADEQAMIMAGAIGWTGFNYSDGDLYQYVRYTSESYWSPDATASAYDIAQRVMEFSIEAVAALDYNGLRTNVTGWYPITAQTVNVAWVWAGTILGVVPFVQLIASICVIIWSNTAIIRDESCLSTARLLRPVVDKLGGKGCLLSGDEISEVFPDMRVKYGWREPDPDYVFRNEIDTRVVRHVDVLEEQEGLGKQGVMPAGFYDGEGSGEECDQRSSLLRRRRGRRRRKSI
ncbi:hypothetical protein EDD37DRAFT_634950 [Exophiala viscosa]|uniref:uncharacterized protein n=1 Tax=Exophiala viscosa TaxID=2486360 RepID=UPI0021931CEE|nr:hypothetical protein EDD37DRAFT_634950 [Exophiala viscosa]